MGINKDPCQLADHAWAAIMEGMEASIAKSQSDRHVKCENRGRTGQHKRQETQAGKHGNEADGR